MCNRSKENETVVYDLKSLQKVKIIKHDFNASNQKLSRMGESTCFDYKFQFRSGNYNTFKASPLRVVSHTMESTCG
ncbi:MAG: hypothetical protein WDO15_17395 [Bacteroidota bacterium]